MDLGYCLVLAYSDRRARSSFYEREIWAFHVECDVCRQAMEKYSMVEVLPRRSVAWYFGRIAPEATRRGNRTNPDPTCCNRPVGRSQFARPLEDQVRAGEYHGMAMGEPCDRREARSTRRYRVDGSSGQPAEHESDGRDEFPTLSTKENSRPGTWHSRTDVLDDTIDP